MTKRICYLCTIFLALITLTAACSTSVEPDPNETRPKEGFYSADDTNPKIAEAHHSFAFDLIHAIAQEDDGNLFISPLSVSFALSMTYNGAAGETQAAMAQTLGADAISLNDWNQGNLILKDVLEHVDPDIQLSIANSLWARQGKTIKKEFLDMTSEHYDAIVESLDFSDPATVDTINAWVEENTEGMIDEIVEAPIDPNTFLFLINAIYFKGNWTDPFKEEHTQEKPFHLSDGTTRDIPMMSKTDDLQYLQGNGFESVRLPYGQEHMSMLLFLPDEDSNLDHFMSELNEENWSEWLSNYEVMEGYLEVPRFQMEYEISLNDVLKSMGMEVAFNYSKANFSNMVDIPPNAYIAEVKHKTFLEVNEDGSEAAAATSVEMRDESAPALNVRFDRPFFFAIHDNSTNTILFMGTMKQPE